MFDLGQQGENAVRTEGGPAACERALMRAVLEDAIRCLVGEVGPPHQRGALAAEARERIETADPHRPLSNQQRWPAQARMSIAMKAETATRSRSSTTMP